MIKTQSFVCSLCYFAREYMVNHLCSLYSFIMFKLNDQILLRSVLFGYLCTVTNMVTVLKYVPGQGALR